MDDHPGREGRLWHPSDLQWGDVDPAGHPFDAARAVEVVRGSGAACRLSERPAGGVLDAAVRAWKDDAAGPWVEEITAGLVKRYGAWAAGWRWSLGEGDHDGGPVHSWCCTAHSVTTAEETSTRVAESLVEWRSWLERLSELFDRLLPGASLEDWTSDEQFVAQWEHVVARLVTVVADQTEAASGWYWHCRQVLRWSLTSAGVPADQAEVLVQHATRGRFHSWTGSAVSEVNAMAEDLAAGIRRARHG